MTYQRKKRSFLKRKHEKNGFNNFRKQELEGTYHNKRSKIVNMRINIQSIKKHSENGMVILYSIQNEHASLASRSHCAFFFFHSLFCSEFYHLYLNRFLDHFLTLPSRHAQPPSQVGVHATLLHPDHQLLHP